MKILIDATPLLLRSAGVKGYLYEWIAAMRALDGGESILTWPPLRRMGELDHTASVASRLDTFLGVGSFLAAHRLGAPVWPLVLPAAEVFHACIMQTRPPRHLRVTATVFDVTPLLMPEHHTPENAKAFEAHAEAVLRKAQGLIAISESSRMDVVRVLGLSPERIETIYCGIRQSYFDASEREAAQAAHRFSLQKPYVLTVGTIEPRKNLDRLLDAWEALRPELRERYDLILAGPAGWAGEATLARLRSGVSGVRWLGYVAESLMPGLTRGAALVAYPSLYEGFGLPLAQAMSCGRAVMTSNVSALPEVAGEAGWLVDPLSSGEIAAGLTALLENDDERRRRGAAGAAIARERYHWRTVAEQSLRFFERVSG